MFRFLPVCVLALAACTHGDTGRSPLFRGAGYVAMGSSFAAGPGIVPLAGPPDLCARSGNNYAQQLARLRGLDLTDVSCSGATTAGVLEGWARLPAQVAALKPDTRLVTITIGGNDVGYVGGLMAASCQQANNARCPKIVTATEARWATLEGALRRIAAEVRSRSPQARLIWVDYPVILPQKGLCAATPLTAEEAGRARRVAARLAALTARVARETGTGLLRASRLSAKHDACAPQPWMNGYPGAGRPVAAAYHPSLEGMTAIADALDRLLGR